jgi:hypothetical protein
MVFNSCKLVAVMLASGLVLGKRYTFYEHVVALGFVSGMVSIAIFTTCLLRHERSSLADSEQAC